MLPPCGERQTGGLVPSGYPTTRRGGAVTQPRTLGNQPHVQGSPDHERSPAPTPSPARRKPDVGSSPPPNGTGPQGSGPNCTLQIPPVGMQLTNPTAMESMLRLIHSHAVHAPDVHQLTVQPTDAHLHPQASMILQQPPEEQPPQGTRTTSSLYTPERPPHTRKTILHPPDQSRPP